MPKYSLTACVAVDCKSCFHINHLICDMCDVPKVVKNANHNVPEPSDVQTAAPKP